MKRTKIAELLSGASTGTDYKVMGWVRAFRSNRFIQLNDGSTINNLQAVVDFESFDENMLKRISTGASLSLTGKLVESQGAGQSVELQVREIEVLGDADPELVQKTVLQPKKHSLEFLREQAHLRFRTNTFGAVFRVRNAVSFAIHKFFNERGFYYIHTPIITGSDAEGAGEMFRVTTLPAARPPLLSKGQLPIVNEEELLEATSSLVDQYINTLIDFSVRNQNNLDTRYSDLMENPFFQTLAKSEGEVFFKTLDFLKASPSQLQKIDEFESQPDRIKIRDESALVEVFTQMRTSIQLFIDGQFGQFDQRRLRVELQKIAKAKNWEFDFSEKPFSSPLLGISFYNLFKVYDKSAVDFSQDFFGKPVNLTVSGQLEGELAAMGLGSVYTFGPTFRAENSNTSRHLAEFWMIEPEVAFNDLNDNMDLAEEMLKYICSYVLETCPDDIRFLDQRDAEEQKAKPVNERNEMGLIDRLNFVINNDFKRITYTEAIEILMNSTPYKKKKFKYDVNWGTDLQSEHERYLVEKEFNRPVIITDYPASFKAFYMRKNDHSEPGKETVAAMDILFPGIGEMVGGSQREERLDVLKRKCADFNIPEEDLWWYLETRKLGTVPHAGFGLGFERMVMFVTGMSNIRDVIPFPRTPQNAEF